MSADVLRYHPRPPGCSALEALLLCAREVRQPARWGGWGARWQRCPDDGALVESEGSQWSGPAGAAYTFPGFAPDGEFLVWVRHLDGVTHEAGVTHVVIDNVGRAMRHRVLDVGLRAGQRQLRLGPGVPC